MEFDNDTIAYKTTTLVLCSMVSVSESEPVCVEVLFVTIFMWASIWGFLDLLAQRLADDARRATMYGVLFAICVLVIQLTPGWTTCRVL